MAGSCLQRWRVDEAAGVGRGDQAHLPAGLLGKLDQDQSVTGWGCSTDHQIDNATALGWGHQATAEEEAAWQARRASAAAEQGSRVG
jgi:hypothetical protein